MRPLTPFVSYFDNAGRMLVGRVRFCNLDGSPARVFADDAGTVTLGNSVFTDSVGRLSVQPYLEDHDYLLYFDRYIGHETMAEDDNPESWEEQGSAVNKYDTLGIHVEGDVVMSVGTVAELRRTDPRTTGAFERVNLLGYYEPGDKPSVAYQWDSRYVGNDNGGSVIVPSVEGLNRGAWVFVECPEELDTRHFGAFPSELPEENPEQRYALQNAGSYAHSNGCGLYFSASPDAVYYDVTGLTLYDVDSADGARIFAVNGDQGLATIVGVKNVTCGGDSGSTGHITLVDSVLRTSFGGTYTNVRFNASERLVIDSTLVNAQSMRSWSGIAVDIIVNPGYCTLDGCSITANRVISGYILLKNCELKTSWFASGYIWSELTSENNKILLDNCSSTSEYIVIKKKQSETDFGDMQGKIVHDVELPTGTRISNALFNNVTLHGEFELTDVTGSVNLYSVTNCTLRDCFLTLQHSPIITSLNMFGGGLSGTSDDFFIRANSITVNGSEISVGIEGGIVGCLIRNSVCNKYVSVNNLVAERTSFAGQVGTQFITASGCTFSDNIIVAFIASIRISFCNNVVNPSARLFIFRDPQMGGGDSVKATNTVISGNTILGENSRTEFWISIDRTYIDPQESHHQYEYSGNVGVMPKVVKLDDIVGGGQIPGAYAWGEWTTAKSVVNLVATRIEGDHKFGSKWFIRLILPYASLTIPNVFAFGTTGTVSETKKRCRIHLFLTKRTGSSEDDATTEELHFETLGYYDKATGFLESCKTDFSLNPIQELLSDGDQYNVFSDVLLAFWRINGNSSFNSKEVPDAGSKMSLRVEPVD